MPSLKDLSRKYESTGLVVVGANGTDDLEGQKTMWTLGGLGFPELHDVDHKIAKAYGVHDFPSWYLIGKDGKIVARGAQFDYGRIRHLVRETCK